MRQPKALVIGIDGVRYDTLLAARTPRLDKLAASGFLVPSPLYPRQPEPTASGSGWSSIASGVWPDKHLVRDNTLAGNALARFPDFLTRATRAGLEAFAGLGWRPLGRIFGEEVGTRIVRDADGEGFAAADLRVLSEARNRLADPALDAAFVYVGAVDECGHHVGTGPEYAQTLKRVDEQVGTLLDTVAGRATYGSENWLTIAVTDHGHADGGGHGEQSAAELTSWVIASGSGVTEPTRTIGVVDVAPTVLTYLGIPVNADWDFDGAPFVGPDRSDHGM